MEITIKKSKKIKAERERIDRHRIEARTKKIEKTSEMTISCGKTSLYK